MTHPTLFDVPKDSFSREQLIAAFKREHRIWTYNSKCGGRDEEPWSAMQMLPGETPDAMWERIGSRCILLEERGELVTAATEREAIKRLCENLGITFTL